MKGKLVCLFAIIGLSFSGVLGGVVVEMATKDLASKQEVVDKIYAQGKMLRIEPNQDRTTPRPILLFRGETFFIINPSNKIFYRIDEETVAGMHEQVSKAIEQMKEQLAKLPPEQRAMVEKMIKGGPKGGAGLGMGLAPRPRRVEAAGEEKVGSFYCKKCLIYRGEEKTSEICAASVDQVGDAAEAMDALQAMALFSEKLNEFFQGPFAAAVENPYQMLNQIEGFPIMTRRFSRGSMVRESYFKSATSQDLGEEFFEPPSGSREASFGRALKQSPR